MDNIKEIHLTPEGRQKLVDELAYREGEKDAEYVIGYLRTLPINGGPNYTEAYSHFAKAANNGNSKAREWMNKFTKHGNGTYSLKSV